MRLTVKQAAALISCSPSLVYSLVRSLKIPSIRVGCRGRGRWLIERAAVDAYVESCKVGAGR